MFRATSLAGAVLIGASAILGAQERAIPKPTDAHKNLSYFAGKWKTTGEVKPGPLGPGGAMTATTTCEWFAGGFHLICRGSGNGPAGEMHSLGIMGHNTETGRYTYYGLDNNGNGNLATGQFNDSTWTWSGDMTVGGQTIKDRYVMEVQDSTTYKWKWEIGLDDGKNWILAASGTDTRTK